jgi:DNA repair ATPase RecN
MTRERDDLACRADALEEKLKDMPASCRAILEEQGMVILPGEEYETIRNIDPKEYETLKKAGSVQKALEQKNSRLADELEKAQAAQAEAKEAAAKLEQMEIQLKTCSQEIEELSLQLETKTKQLEQSKEELEKSEVLRQNQAIELAQAYSRYQMLELQYKLALEKNQQLARDRESQEKETARTKELWDTDRSILMQRFGGIFLSQQQTMQNIRETVAAAMQYMEKLGVDFLNQPAAEAAKEK